eukprot:344759_1
MDIDKFEQYHDLSLVNNTNDTVTNDIVEILGGIDDILKTYISLSKRYTDDDMVLTPTQMEQIHRIILADTQIVPSIDVNDVEDIDANKTYYFNRNDTFLHSVCCNDQIANKIIAALYHKLLLFPMWIITVIWVLITTFFHQVNPHQVTWFFILEVIYECGVICYFILLTASCNKKAFKLIVTGFDFWIKLYYSIMALVTDALYVRRAGYHVNEIVYIDLSAVMITQIIIYFSLMEGFNVSWKTMFALGIIVSCIVSLQAARFTIWFDGEEQYIRIFEGVKFGLIGYFAVSLQVLSIFLWKQTIMAAWYKGKLCISIYLSPKIQWVDGVDFEEFRKMMQLAPIPQDTMNKIKQ